MQVVEHMVLDANANVRFTKFGYMVAQPRVARTGIQVYRGSEVGNALMDRVRVYRPPEEVFSKDAMKSLAHCAVTNNHPTGPVTADTWKDVAVGHSFDPVMRDGDCVRVPVLVMDGKSIKDVKNGKKELSVGYTCDLVWGAGMTADGEAYDAKQTHIQANHIAIVDAARGGERLRIGDGFHQLSDADYDAALIATRQRMRQGDDAMFDLQSLPTQKENTKMNTQLIMVDSQPIEVPATSAAALLAYVSKTDAAIKRLTDAMSAAEMAAAKKKEDDAAAAKASAEKCATDAALIATKDAQIADLKKQVEDSKLSPQKLDALVKDRATIVVKAQKMVTDSKKLVIDGKSVEEIRRQVVDAKLGDKAKGWTDDQIMVSFDTLSIGLPNVGGTQDNSLADALSRAPAGGVDVRDAAYAEYNKKLANAWKTPAANA